MQNKKGFAMQIVRRPVRRNVRAVPPNRAALHSAHCLPDVLAVGDFFCWDEKLAVGRYDFSRNRWRLTKNLCADPAQYRERKYKDRDKNQPKFLHKNPFRGLEFASRSP